LSLPTTRIGNVKLTRLVMGGNPIRGFSHGGATRDAAMIDYFTTANAKALLSRLEKNGIDTVFLRGDRHINRLLREYWNEGGKLQWVAQTQTDGDPIRNVDQPAAAGAKAIYVHGGTIDHNFERGDMDTARRQLDRIHELGLPAGVASHMPSNIRKLLDLGWPIDFFMICLYNIPGYRGKLGAGEDEKFIEGDRAKSLVLFKQIEVPCVAYKIMGAGRVPARRAFEEVGRFLKAIDLVNVGMYPPDNPRIVEENVALATEFLPR
jgi:hypothetical protein